MQPAAGHNYSPWEMWTAMSRQMQQLAGTIAQQQTALQKLSADVAALSERLASAESKPMYNVERLEYHFDQLKVEKLDGTLNIGMTPPTEEQFKEIGQIVVPGGAAALSNGPGKNGGAAGLPDQEEPFPASPSFLGMAAAGGQNGALPQPPYPEIRREVELYLATAAPGRLAQLEAECGISLDPYHRSLIIDDIRKQIGPRINYYIQAEASSSKTASTDSNDSNPEQSHANVIAKTTRDIDAALCSYITGLKAANNNSGGMSP